MANSEQVSRYLENIRGEIDSAHLYRTLSEIEPDQQLSRIYDGLAKVEERHIHFWRGKLDHMGIDSSSIAPSWRSRTLCWLARRFGPDFVLATVNARESADVGSYDNQPEAVAQGLPGDERAHARIVQAAASRSNGSGLSGSSMARLEGRHRGMGGNALRAAVLGANDGLVSNLSLVMGVAGAEADSHTILLTGLAGLVAGACSMALGEWLSVSSSRESFQSQIATEAEELDHSPDEEREELVLIYQAKGLPEDEARQVATRMMGSRETALDALAREELGVDPDDLGGSPWTAAGSSFGLFAIGAIFPIVPYFFLSGLPAVVASLASAGVALFGIGAGTSLFTGRGVLFSGARQLLVGYAAAAFTYGIGRLVGVSLGG